MQDEVNSKVVALSVRVGTTGAKMTADVLKAAIRKYLRDQDKKKSAKAMGQSKIKKGKQTVAQLMNQNQGLANIEITDQNIRSFEKVANKYNIDFALKKDKASEIPKYIVFFKARDVDVMTQAFKEYSAKELTKSKRPSVRKILEKAIARSKEMAKGRDKSRQREKHRDRGQSL